MLRNRNVWLLGVASLLNDVASEMVMPLLPVFLVTVLGGGAATLGAIEGAADLVASGLKWLAGVASDRTGRSRPFVWAGYGLAGLARPFLAFASAPGHVLAVRLVDRVGKGIRTAPRDALLSASVAPEQRGAAFGFHQSMDHLGAAIGPAVALLLLLLWTKDLRAIFLVAAVPGLAAALVVPFTVEVRRPPASAGSEPISPELWRFLLPVAVVSFGTASDAFLMLQAGVASHAPIESLPVIWVVLHLVRTAAATPGGWLSDRVDPRWVVAAGWG
ncbi:MAG: MFS transporter, partial [Myxococcota bacterium]